jgi:hypothetical protein
LAVAERHEVRAEDKLPSIVKEKVTAKSLPLAGPMSSIIY